jgi:hypothetical protein
MCPFSPHRKHIVVPLVLSISIGCPDPPNVVADDVPVMDVPVFHHDFCLEECVEVEWKDRF